MACGFCHASIEYTSESMNDHKKCKSRPKRFIRQHCITPEEQSAMFKPIKTRIFPQCELVVVLIDGYTEQESKDIITKAHSLQKLEYNTGFDSVYACIVDFSGTTWMIGNRFTVDEVIECLSQTYHCSLRLFMQ
jgi:hypothetical protein